MPEDGPAEPQDVPATAKTKQSGVKPKVTHTLIQLIKLQGAVLSELPLVMTSSAVSKNAGAYLLQVWDSVGFHG